MLRGVLVLVLSLLFLTAEQFGVFLFGAMVLFFCRFLILLAMGIYKNQTEKQDAVYENEDFVRLDENGNIDWSEYL